MRKIAFILLALAFSNPLFAEDKKPTEKRNFTIDDSFLIKGVGGPKISPDGKWIAYGVTTTVLEEDESYYRIWLVPAAG